MFSGKNRNIGAAGHSKFASADFVPTSEAVKEFDEYRYFGDTLAYTMFSDQYVADGDSAKKNEKPGSNGEKDQTARKSLFSSINTVLDDCDYRTAMNMPLWDTPENREDIKSRTACTIRDLVKASEQGKMGRAVYQYADFMFCKDLGKMPNNYMITLRRFPDGCGDHINYVFGEGAGADVEKKTQMHSPDIGRMITWLNTGGNDMESILKYSYNMPYEKLTAEFEKKQGSEGSGLLKQLFQVCDKSYQAQVLKGQVAGSSFQNIGVLSGRGKYSGDWNVQGERASFLDQYDKNRSYGPLDVIKSTHKRAQGLEFSHKFTLNFDYELRSYDGVNGKAAFLDLLANILCVTYTTGKFWGGARLNTGAHQSMPYSNLPIWQWEKNAPQDVGAVVDDIMDSISMIFGAAKEKVKSAGGILEFGKQLLGGFGTMLLGGMLNKLGRPDKWAYSSLLSDAPVGMWHVTIGNPRNPILSVGNLILTNCEIKHSGPLGIDDFPTQLRVTCELESAMPRDITKIEQMYLMGDSRIYTPMSITGQKVYENSKRYKSSGNGKTVTSNKDTAESATSSASNVAASNVASVSGSSTAHWLTKQFGLPTNGGNVYDLAQRAFNAALNGSSMIKDKQIKK